MPKKKPDGPVGYTALVATMVIQAREDLKCNEQRTRNKGCSKYDEWLDKHYPATKGYTSCLQCKDGARLFLNRETSPLIDTAMFHLEQVEAGRKEHDLRIETHRAYYGVVGHQRFEIHPEA
uniref:Uncharacterized protein n=1 Tax=viral metagenome TaxID=1070528 RepID=A0A6H1ZPI9_9ZZZZ